MCSHVKRDIIKQVAVVFHMVMACHLSVDRMIVCAIANISSFIKFSAFYQSGASVINLICV